MSIIRALGLMSGTSMDGVDIALVETDGAAQVRFGPTGFFPYEPEDRALLRSALTDANQVAERSARPGALAAAETLVTERHRQAVDGFLEAQGIDRVSIDIVGFHGQTVVHRPQQRLTVQIGDGASLARTLRLGVAYDFRAADVAAGGQGAPLVPIFHRALAGHAGLEGPLVILNVGGVANLTFIDGDADPIAFDTGPGNALLDDLMLRRSGVAMDQGGAAAASGNVDAVALGTLLAHPYFARGLPKSLDRNDFSSESTQSLGLEDAAATLTAFTAHAIGRALRLLPRVPRLAILCGGGAHNLALRSRLMEILPCGLVTADAIGWSGDAIEAQAFAYLAVRHLKNLPITFPSTTGVKQPLQGGRLALPL
ncbi:MAG: anhydro-N-acetylmuramic acid kinase [Beijerinckiaceae bacterium]